MEQQQHANQIDEQQKAFRSQLASLGGIEQAGHVAGTAAGLGVPGQIGPGVAPEADLYAIKVFDDEAHPTNLTPQGVEWAMDPDGDGDMSDHLDVINMSLGSNFGGPDDAESIASQNASAHRVNRPKSGSRARARRCGFPRGMCRPARRWWFRCPRRNSVCTRKAS